MRNSGNWADLPVEILHEMLTKLPDIEDLIRFGCVSRSWRSASVESNNKTSNSFVPWMMLAEPESPLNFLYPETVMLITMFNQERDQEESNNEHKHKQASRRFINVSSKKTIDLYLPEAQGRRCFGSNFGWILTLGLDFKIHLLNPLTRVQITLPPQPTFPNQCHRYVPPEGEDPYLYTEPETEYFRRTYLEKFALSNHPNHHQGYVIMVIYSPDRILAFARSGDKAWTDVKCTEELELFDDVIFFNNLFYAVHHMGDVLVCDITKPVPVATVFMSTPFIPRYHYRHYLVEMSGGLHMVLRMYKRDEYESTVEFRVYKLDFRIKKWRKLKGLGDNSLFLGNNGSFSINHPQLRSNCIYFTDDRQESYGDGIGDIGLFDFGEKKIVDKIHSGDCFRSTFCTPLFFIPNLH